MFAGDLLLAPPSPSLCLPCLPVPPPLTPGISNSFNILLEISISLFSAFVHSHPVTAGLGCLPWMVILLSLSSSSLHCYNHHHCHHHQKDDKIERLSKESPQVTFSPPRLPGFTRRPGPPCLGQSANTKVFPSFWGFFLNNYFQASTSVWIIAANKEVKTKRNI